MGVITEGKAGTELQGALQRLEKKRGVKFIRADTGSARSFEYNAERILEAIESTKSYNVPFGLLGYSQGAANALMAESILYSGTPEQQDYIKRNLACRQLLFSAANGSSHGASTDKKASRIIVMVEEFGKCFLRRIVIGFSIILIRRIVSLACFNSLSPFLPLSQTF
jgi:hypothetical protein